MADLKGAYISSASNIKRDRTSFAVAQCNVSGHVSLSILFSLYYFP